MAFRILLIPCAAAVIFLAAFLMMRYFKTPEMQEAMADPILKDLQTRHPGLVVESPSRLLAYWFKEPSTGREAAVPTSELEGATVRFVKCDLPRIPPNLLYPERTETTCLEVENQQHRLDAYFFRTNDSVDRVVDFFELNFDPQSRIPAGVHFTDTERHLRKPFTHEFIYSSFISTRTGRWAFIAYGEEKH